ncbi:MAG: PqqD family protein [Burkholderiales bacterium]|nr:PqqD family protein [Phycisphaerae bacterium]
MLFRKKKPRLTPEQALEAKPIRLVEAVMQPLPDDGGMLKVQMRQPKWGRLIFRLPENATKSYEFDTIGVFVWESIDGKTTVRQIIKRLAARYDLNLREAQVPTVKFLEMLIRKGLVGIPLEKK